MSRQFASEKRAAGICDRCGFRYPLKDLKTYKIMGKIINSRVCPSCWDADHPQNWIGIIGTAKAASDPQALRDSRPDTGRGESTGLFAWKPVATQTVTTTLCSITVTIT